MLRWEPSPYRKNRVDAVADFKHGRYWIKKSGRHFNVHHNRKLVSIETTEAAAKARAEIGAEQLTKKYG